MIALKIRLPSYLFLHSLINTFLHSAQSSIDVSGGRGGNRGAGGVGSSRGRDGADGELGQSGDPGVCSFIEINEDGSEVAIPRPPNVSIKTR